MYLLSFILGGLNALLRQLRLSISSIEFYKDVYKNYQGYGIRYVFTLSFIPSIIYCIFILNYIITLKDYFNGIQSSKVTANIEYIINQLPEIKYNNSNISVEEVEPIYLYSKNNHKIVVIDTKNQVSNEEKSKIPFVLEENKLKINLIVGNTKKNFPSTVNYSEIFKQNEVILTPEIIKKYFADNLLYAPNLFIYFGMPAIILFWFVTFLLERSIIVLLVYSLANLLTTKTSIQTSIRLVMFSSGVPIILQPIIIILIPELSILLQLLQMFTTCLVFVAIWQINKNLSHYI
ncbi:hypothetical protein A3305_06865 [Rickettsia amblyommatis]|uniref:Putative membrane protein n=1 Tax=Rickettsia amblyommatis str. Ac/Pa TaxID=1359164 RepID=A0A0F3N2X0_RICAM|nr:DUF1189 family protein [Rickettsia amblyommatis]ALA61932.1 hypothetical protein AL573_04750 [Rickettsia amblyommatis]ARD88040.1 hypothetical protein A3305_06865 [Rickettsia amblyommatis]KJV62398.1 putative membrane protein [Rickettsia amblyommatis str. Ac/Pa]KJV91328.1 putative membrane protein [Rickettsia amblyommatis str. Darkwater]